jgi:hypothetical protein
VNVSGRELSELLPKDEPPLLAGGATAIDPVKTYRLVTVDYNAQGWVERGRKLQVVDEGVLLRDLLIDWIKQRKVIP